MPASVADAGVQAVTTQEREPLALGERPLAHRPVIVGTGGLDLPAFMKRLDAMGFTGYMSLEYEGDADNPLPKVKECITVIRKVISGL